MTDVRRLMLQGGGNTDLPVADAMDLIDQARADDVAEEVLRRLKAALVAPPVFPTAEDPFGAPSEGFNEMPPPLDEGNPFLGDAETPFDAPSAYQTGQPIGITSGSYNPLIRSVRPGFEEFGRFGYPQLDSDPYSRNLINTLRRMVRGAQ